VLPMRRTDHSCFEYARTYFLLKAAAFGNKLVSLYRNAITTLLTYLTNP
jgi:hypothetical protein